MPGSPTVIAAPSVHALSLAGADLENAAPPVVRVEAAREVVVVVSRLRDAAREVLLDRCAADHVPVVRRPSGGGAVVLGPGVIAASVVVVAAPGTFPDVWFRRFGAAVADALDGLGVAGVAMRGVSDLCLGDRKIAGSSLRLAGGRVLYQLSLLVDLDLELLDRYLPMPARAPAYRRDRPHRAFVATLRSAGFDVHAERVLFALHGALAGIALRAQPASV